MNLIEILSGPAIGALIGYFTNYIAVKMLFLPRKPVKVLGCTLPFTPGIIPRRKGALAKALGSVVENELFTKSALCEMLLTDRAKNAVAAALCGALTDGERTLGDALGQIPNGEEMRRRAETLITNELCAALGEFDLATPIAAEGKALIREKFGALGGLFASDELMAGIADCAQERIRAYLTENKEQIRAILHEKTDRLLSRSPEEITDALELSAQDLFFAARDGYEQLVRTYVPDLLSHVSIADAVETRVQAMDARRLEELILSVMKRELHAVINLGAVVGFLLGLLNLLV